MAGMKFGIEAEYALIRPDGAFADFTNTSFSEVQPVIDALPFYGHSELRVGDAGIRVKNWYVEGDERFDESGRSTGLAFKGVEIRTPVFSTIEEALGSLKQLRLMLEAELRSRSWSLTAIGFNPCTASYAPAYTPWEKEFHASHIENSLPEISTLSYGPDLNFSRAVDTPEAVIGTVRRLTYYSPYIVPFSFSSPLFAGELWEGLSYRTYRRSGIRPAALAHLTGRHGHPLVKKADPSSQHLRIEFKAFDMIGDDELLGELFRLVVGISMADGTALPGMADAADRKLHQQVALSGFADDAVHQESARVVAIARDTLKAEGFSGDFPLLEHMLAARLTPAHAMREPFARRRDWRRSARFPG
ncbi:MAG TPA: hypothetical protein VGR19_01230 [Allosphingosinicella sp.]|nr:hypothetical protein [Allosphingosinicella sp.]